MIAPRLGVIPGAKHLHLLLPSPTTKPPTRGSEVRFVIELNHMGDEQVEGTVSQEGTDQPQGFCGWLELLGLLEAPQALPLPEA